VESKLLETTPEGYSLVACVAEGGWGNQTLPEYTIHDPSGSEVARFATIEEAAEAFARFADRPNTQESSG
jgi:hypothetical protein